MPDDPILTPVQQMSAITDPADHLAVNDNAELAIDGHAAPALLAQFGSPLFVYSELTLRDNYRRIRSAFADCWPAPVNIMYAIKANTSLAVRAVLSNEGAGGDCFSEGEFHATFTAGADPALLALNGGCKTRECLRIAIEHGVLINIDAESEIEQIVDLCRSVGKTARVGIRVKPQNSDYNRISTDYFGGRHLAEFVRRTKWGFSVAASCELVVRIGQHEELELVALSSHIGRAAQDPGFMRHYGVAVGRFVTEIFEQSGFAPSILDIGGGWPRRRDPESKSRRLNETPIEDYVEACCTAILSQLEAHGMETPSLWIEPGRFIIGNVSTLIATVGTIKRDVGCTWVNIDASTNDLPRIDTSGSTYHVLAANGMQRPADQLVDVVGPTCIDSLMGRDLRMPELVIGDAVAILDAGMYSEAASTQFNSLPRPAAIMVCGDEVDIVKQRETVADVFHKHQIPERLQSKS